MASVGPGRTRLKGNEAVEFDVEELQTGLSCRDAQNTGQGSGLNGQHVCCHPSAGREASRASQRETKNIN